MSAATLAALQRRFLERMRGGGAGFDDAIAQTRMPAGTGLRIYRNAYDARLREALEHDHAALAHHLGDARWRALCADYIAACPSRHHSLRDFGNALPQYLRTAPAYAGAAELAQLAAFERGLLDSFDAADAAPALWRDLATLPPARWPTLLPHLHPSVRVLRFDCNVVEIWRAAKQSHAPPAVTRRASTWVLWRDAERVGRFRSLEPAEADAVGHIAAGGDLAGLCDVLAASHAADAVPGAMLAVLQRWCGDGWIRAWDSLPSPGQANA